MDAQNSSVSSSPTAARSPAGSLRHAGSSTSPPSPSTPTSAPSLSPTHTPQPPSLTTTPNRDATSLHALQADESIPLGPLALRPTNPYLDAPLLVDLALRARAHAIHPGYGYLSEDPAFATLVRAAGLVFVGPSPAAMSTLGNKRAAKAYLAQHAPAVPLIPGFAGSGQDVDELERAAGEIGFPVMLKAAAGGGGKGMRVVRAAGELREALERARSEAERSFGSADCILEKYVECAKHVEVQVVGDGHGRVVCLWERDCSVQRRHQKIVEETPCAWLGEGMRREMAATAVRIAELIGYEGAGTVEFVVDVRAGRFYFLEVNARLQVEHPITEEVTGLDIVALQLFVAAGGSLASLPALNSIPRNGHAIECRLCAEDPHRNFLPERGTVRLWHPPPSSETRYETAIQTGSEVSIYFDPMIAKIVVWAPTRLLAVEKMIRVLSQTACLGVKTNQLFLQSCLMHSAFRDPAYTTSFIPDNLESLLQSPYPQELARIKDLHSVLPCVVLRHIRAQSTRPFRNVRRGFRNQRADPINQHCNVIESRGADAALSQGVDDHPSICILQQAAASNQAPDTYTIHLAALAPPQPNESASPAAHYNALSAFIRASPPPSSTAALHALTPIPPPPATNHADTWPSFSAVLALNGRRLLAHLAAPPRCPDDPAAPHPVLAHFPSLGAGVAYAVHTLLSFAETMRPAAETASGASDGVVKAPMPCRVLGVVKADGEEVQKGENVLVVESMKMEMSIVAPVAGTVRMGRGWGKGDSVGEGEVLCSVE